MFIINKEDRIQIWTKQTKYSYLPIHLLQLKQIQDISIQTCLLKHVHIIIKIKVDFYKTDI